MLDSTTGAPSEVRPIGQLAGASVFAAMHAFSDSDAAWMNARRPCSVSSGLASICRGSWSRPTLSMVNASVAG